MYINNTKQFYLEEIKHTLEKVHSDPKRVVLPKGMSLAIGRHSGQYVCTYERPGRSILSTVGATGKEAAQRMKDVLKEER